MPYSSLTFMRDGLREADADTLAAVAETGANPDELSRYLLDDSRVNRSFDQGIQSAERLADQIFGPSERLSEDDLNRLRVLEGRARRLAPSRMFGFGEQGGGAIPGNPFSIDTRGLLTGLSNMAVSVANKYKNARLIGDPEKMQENMQAAEEIQKAMEELGTQIEMAEAAEEEERLAQLQAEQAGLERDLQRTSRRAERFEPTAAELGQLRGRQAIEDRRRKLIEDFGPRLAERILQRESDALGVDQRAARDDAAREARQEERMDTLEREWELRGANAELVAGLRNNRTSPEAMRLQYSQARELISASPEGTNVRILRGELDSMRKALNSMRGDFLSDPAAIQRMEADIKTKEEAYRKANEDVYKLWIKLNPGVEGMLDRTIIDRVLDDEAAAADVGGGIDLTDI